MKRAILVALLSAVVVVGCAKNKKTEAQPAAPADTTFTNPQPTPAPAPIYTPAPETGPAVTAAPQPQPAPVPAAQPAKKTTAAKPAAETKSTAKTTSSKLYVVKKGDTLSEIAKEHHTTVKKILALNEGLKADKILVGQKIKLP